MIRSKPKKKEADDMPEEVKNIIYKSGTVEADKETKKEEWTTISLRIPIRALEEVDQKVKKRLGLTRTAWILEAIQKHMGE